MSCGRCCAPPALLYVSVWPVRAAPDARSALALALPCALSVFSGPERSAPGLAGGGLPLLLADLPEGGDREPDTCVLSAGRGPSANVDPACTPLDPASMAPRSKGVSGAYTVGPGRACTRQSRLRFTIISSLQRRGACLKHLSGRSRCVALKEQPAGHRSPACAQALHRTA